MDKKRSIGVTIFAWSFIIINVFGLLSVPSIPQSYSFISKSPLSGVIVYAIVISVIGLIAGINLLRLKEWSRRLVIALVLAGFLELIFFVPLNHRSIEITIQHPNIIGMFEKQYDEMPAEAKAKIPLSKEEFVKRAARLSSKIGGIFTGILEAMLAIYLFLLLWFFTKINIKKQFS